MQIEYEVDKKYKVLSFDGTSKTSEGGPQNIPYWEDDSPQTAEVKKRVLAKASPEAIAFWKEGLKTLPGKFDASGLTPEEWKDRRRLSIGSSAASHVTGDCPFEGCTPYDLYNEKVGSVSLFPPSEEEAREREDRFDYGHVMETYLRGWVRRHWPNSKLVIDTNIYNDGTYPVLTANLDGMLQLPDGSWVHIEFKTASAQARHAYDDNNIPLYYRRQLIQCQRILNVWSSRLIVKIEGVPKPVVCVYERDLDAEMEQVKMEQEFWEDNVMARVPPDLCVGPSQNVLKAIRDYGGRANENIGEVVLPDECLDSVKEIFEINKELSSLATRQRSLETLKKQKIVEILPALKNAVQAVIQDGAKKFLISYKPQKARPCVDLETLENDYPEIYKKTVSFPAEGPRPFKIKEAKS